MAVLASRNPADLTHKVYSGLLDTGATSSWISPKVIGDLNLVEVTKERVSFATDQQIVPLHLFRLGLFADEISPTTLPYVFAELRGFRMRQRDDFDVIVGMDVLSQGDFAMDRSGNWRLQF